LQRREGERKRKEEVVMNSAKFSLNFEKCQIFAPMVVMNGSEGFLDGYQGIHQVSIFLAQWK
jgi:hypothetical protein